MSEFRDDMALAMHLADPDDQATYGALADHILAMPGMEWIQDWLSETQAGLDPTCPPAVRAWIEVGS